MQIRKTLIVALAVVVAIAFSPLSELKAAPFAGNGSQAAGSELVHAAQAKGEGRRRKPERRSARARRAKRQVLAKAAGPTCTAKEASASTGPTRNNSSAIPSRWWPGYSPAAIRALKVSCFITHRQMPQEANSNPRECRGSKRTI